MTDTRIPIPDEVWDAFHEAVQKYGYGPHAIAACLAAWPRAWEWPDTAEGRALVLPLQEARDE